MLLNFSSGRDAFAPRTLWHHPTLSASRPTFSPYDGVDYPFWIQLVMDSLRGTHDEAHVQEQCSKKYIYTTPSVMVVWAHWPSSTVWRSCNQWCEWNVRTLNILFHNLCEDEQLEMQVRCKRLQLCTKYFYFFRNNTNKMLSISLCVKSQFLFVNPCFKMSRD